LRTEIVRRESKERRWYGVERRRKREVGCVQKNREGFEIRMKLRRVE